MAPDRPTTDDLAGTARPPDPFDDEPTDAGRQEPDVQPPPPQDASLLDPQEADAFLARWSEVQGRFVDDPQGAVRDGDSLVAELMQALASRFSDHKGRLEEQWQRGSEPETEELRLALQQYRSFFQRLLST